MSIRFLALSLLLASPLAAQQHPDFSGTWVLDATKTVVDGPLPAPSTATYTVTQVGDSMSIDQQQGSDQGSFTLKKVWKADGKPWTNYLSYQGTDMTLSSVLKWNGAVLEVHTTTDFAGTPVTQDETWTLSNGGKTLTHATTSNANGAYYASVTLVLNKK